MVRSLPACLPACPMIRPAESIQQESGVTTYLVDANSYREYDAGVGLLGFNVLPKLTAPKALAARNRIQEILRPFYLDRHYLRDDVADIMKNRAISSLDVGLTEHDLGNVELTMPWVATTNTIPVLFWLFVNLFSKPDYVARVRGEVEDVVAFSKDVKGDSVATIDISKLENDCPMLMSCYREVLRLYNDFLGNRRVMQDTTIRDIDGREYLLKEGMNMQWTSGVPHMSSGIWGQDVNEFNPDRWLNPPAVDEKKRRGAMIPFGGGKHLCPGRRFALAENLGFVGAVALAFETDGVQLPAGVGAVRLGTAIRRPIWGEVSPAFKLKRREGWENVTLAFTC